jgi:hypothetical protein
MKIEDGEHFLTKEGKEDEWHGSGRISCDRRTVSAERHEDAFEIQVAKSGLHGVGTHSKESRH